ncbi:MAG: hypothetical protein K8S27_13860 [Candidatus Omnitrophica bacterium]|nr:hypothetical protein [Candidatus Omnitrophota bacterium]
MNKQKIFLISPISFLSKTFYSFLKKFNYDVYCRGRFDKDVLSDTANDHYDQASDAFRAFTDDHIQQDRIKAIAEKYGLDPTCLGKFSRDVMMSVWHFDFCFTFTAVKKFASSNAIIGFVSYPPTWWKSLEDILGYKTNIFFSAILMFERRCRIFVKSTLKMILFSIKLLSWLFLRSKENYGYWQQNYIWLSGDKKNVLTRDSKKNSLPCFLSQLRVEGKIQQKFIIIAPALKKDEWWEDEDVVARSNVWDFFPDVSLSEVGGILKQFFYLYIHLFFNFFSSKPDFEILIALFDYIFIGFVLQKLDPKAVLYSQSTFGAGNSFVYASAEKKIKSFLIYYGASNFRPAVESKVTYQLFTSECQNVIADHIFVWNEHTRKHFESIGREKNVHIVGTQIFSPCYPLNHFKPNTRFTIGVFFGVPFAKEHIYRMGLGNYFHDVSYCAEFWRSLFSVVSKVYQEQFMFLVKLKIRGNNQKHYDTWFRSLKKEYPFFDDVVQICSETENLWDLVQRTDCCVSTALSSAACVPLDFGIPSIHYDQAGIVKPIDNLGIPLLCDENFLIQWFRDLRNGRIKKYKIDGKKFDLGAVSLARMLNLIMSES